MSKFKKLIAALSTVTILSTLVVTTAQAATFPDVPSWAEESVEYLVSIGAVDSTQLSFRAGDNMNRAEAVKLIGEAIGLEGDVPTTATFVDVKASEWYFTWVERAYAAGIVNGYSDRPGYFGPADTLTKGQWAKIVVEGSGMSIASCDASIFGDVKADAWECKYVTTLAAAGLVDTSKANFEVGKQVNRAEAAKMLYGVLTYDGSGADDDDDTSDDDDDTVVDGDVDVSLSNDSPETGDAVIVDEDGDTSEYRATLVAFDFEADADAQVNKIELTRKGFFDDEDFDEIHLYVDGVEVADGPSNSTPKNFVFSSNGGLFDIEGGETVVVEVKVEFETTAQGGDTVGFNLTDVELKGGDVSGLPVSGPTLVLVDQDLATANINFDAGFSVATPEIGAEYEQLVEFELEISDDVLVETLTFTVDGSVSAGDLENFVLTDEDETELATVAQMGANDSVSFTGLDLELDTDETYKIFADIADGAARTFEFTIDDDNESFVYDQGLGVRIELTGDNDMTAETIGAGDFDVDLASDTPVGNVPVDGDSVLLARYKINAGGERVKVTGIEFACLSDDVTIDLVNVKVRVDGSQKGSTDSAMDCDGATTSTFTFGSSVVLEPGEVSYVEIAANLTHANVDVGETLQITGGADFVTYDLLDSDTDDVTTELPDGDELVLASAEADIVLSGDSPEAKVIGMGKVSEVGRWFIEPQNDDMDLIDANFDINFDPDGVVTTSALTTIRSGTLALYHDGDMIDSVTVNMKGSSVDGQCDNEAEIWFGNEEDKTVCTSGTYTDTDALDWELLEDEQYELVLSLDIKPSATGSSSPLSGATITVDFDSYSYDPADTVQQDDEDAGDIAAEAHEVRAAHISLEEVKTSYSGAAAAANQEAMQFKISNEGGLEKATVTALKFSVSNSAGGALSGTGDFTIRKGSTSGTTVASLANATPTDLTVASVAGNSTVTFATAHGLAVGSVFLYDDDADDTSDVAVVVTKVTNATVVEALELDGTALVNDVDGYESAAGNVVFAEAATLYVPFKTEALGQISSGSSQSYSVAIDTTGAANDDTVNLSINDGSSVYWFDNNEGVTFSLLVDFVTSRIDEFPIQSEWEK